MPRALELISKNHFSVPHIYQENEVELNIVILGVHRPRKELQEVPGQPRL